MAFAGGVPFAAPVDDDGPLVVVLGDDVFASPGVADDDWSWTAVAADPRRLDSRSCDGVKSIPREERTVLRMMFSQMHARCREPRSSSGLGVRPSRD